MRPDSIAALAPRFDDGDPHLMPPKEPPPPRAQLRPLGLWRTLARLKFLPPRKAA